MKNFKRFTALVLVIALAASFMITAGAADAELSFSDAKDITAVEAVEVLSNSKVNIIQGFDTGDFQPAGAVTREQAIKMISVALLGGDYGSSLSGTDQLFSDVLGTRWSAGYIAYGVSQGIIVGYGDGKFGPADSVTYGQLAKMLLTAIGYGKKGEYEGSGWLLASISDAQSLKIFDKLSVSNYSDPCPRNDAAQMIFNAITSSKCNMVSYSKDTQDYTSKGQTIGEKAFDLKKNNAATDDLGRPAHQWKVGKTNVSGVYTDGAKLSYTAGVKGTTLAKALKDYTYKTGTGSSTAATFDLYINGVINTDMELSGFEAYLTDGGDYKALEDDATNSSGNFTADTVFTSGRGIAIEFYANGDDVITDIVVVNTYFGEIRSVTAAKGDADRYVTVRYYEGSTAKTVDFETEDFAKGDYVLVTPTADGAATVTEATSSLRGTVTKISNTTNYTIGGNSYSTAKLAAQDAVAIDFDSTYDFYLDEYGYIIGAIVYETTDSSKIENYLYIEDAKPVTGSGVNAGGANARAYFMDGTNKVIDLKIKSGKLAGDIGNDVLLANIVNAYDDSTPADRGLVGGFYTYSVDSNKEYTLTALDSAKAVQTATSGTYHTAYVEKNSVYVKSAEGSSTNVFTQTTGKSTVLTVVDGKVTPYSGASNFPAKGVGTASNTTDYLGTLALIKDNSITQLVMLFKGGVAADKVYGMYTGDYYRNSDGDYVYTFNTIDGQKDYVISTWSGTSRDKDLIYEIDDETATSLATTSIEVDTENGTNFTYIKSNVTYTVICDDDSKVVAKGGGSDTLEEGDEAFIYVKTVSGDTVLVAAFIK